MTLLLEFSVRLLSTLLCNFFQLVSPHYFKEIHWPSTANRNLVFLSYLLTLRSNLQPPGHLILCWKQDLGDLKEKGYICQKSTALLKNSLTTLSLERKKMIFTLLEGYGKNPFLPLVQCCCSSSWSGLWAVFLHRNKMKPLSESTGPECDLADMNFTCSGGHFVGYLLAALVQKG